MPAREVRMIDQLTHLLPSGCGIEWQVLRAVESPHDARVRDFVKKNIKDLGYRCTLSHQLALKIASESQSTSCIIEDDVALHKDFLKTVLQLGDAVNECGCISIGYLLRDANTATHGDLTSATDVAGYKYGRSKQAKPWGTQAYLVTPRYAKQVFDRRHKLLGPGNVEAEVFELYPFKLVPPIAIEDYAKCGTLLNHTQNNKCFSMAKKCLDLSKFWSV